MKALSAIELGLRTSAKNPKIAIWCYLSSLAVSLPVAIAIGLAVDQAAAHTLLGGAASSGFDPEILSLVQVKHGSAIGLAVSVVMAQLVLWAVLSLFVDAAVLSALQTGTGFFRGGASLCIPIFKLALVMTPLVALVTLAPVYLLYLIAETWAAGEPSERAIFLIRISVMGVGLLLLWWSTGAHDLMKAELALRATPNVLEACRAGAKKACARPGTVLAIVAPHAAVGIALAFAASLIEPRLAASNTAAIAGGILMHQLFVVGRAFLQVSLAAAELAFVREGPTHG